MPQSSPKYPRLYRPREVPVYRLPLRAHRTIDPIVPIPEPFEDEPLPQENTLPIQPDHPQTDTGEIPLLDDYIQDNGYQSAYPPDGTGIVREYIPTQEQPKEDASPTAPANKEEQRASLSKRLSLVIAIVLALCLLAAALLLIFLPRSTKSAIEKRELATFPAFSLESYFSGDYTAAIANYYTDTVPDRDGLKRLGSHFKAVFGLPSGEADVEFIGNIQKLTPPKFAAAPTHDPGSALSHLGEGLEGAAGRHMALPSPAPEAVPAENPFHQAEEAGMVGESQIMLIKQNGHYRGLEPFGGSADMAGSYVSALNDLHTRLGDSVRLWSMPAPLACQFYTPDNLSEYVNDQSACFDSVHAQLNEGITGINICDTLSQHAQEPIYCRTDHHWQPLGAYYAAQAFAQAADVPFPDLSTYTPGAFSGFVGSMYAFSNQSAKILNDPEDFTYYIPQAQYETVYYDSAFQFEWDNDDLFAQGVDGSSDAYLYYLGGDQYIVKATTQVENDRTLLIIKDSYGNAVVPFLTGSFHQIFVADMRYMERNLTSFIQDMGVTDVLFTMSAFSLVGENGANIANLITQNEGETITDPHP